MNMHLNTQKFSWRNFPFALFFLAVTIISYESLFSNSSKPSLILFTGGSVLVVIFGVLGTIGTAMSERSKFMLATDLFATGVVIVYWFGFYQTFKTLNPGF